MLKGSSVRRVKGGRDRGGGSISEDKYTYKG